MPALLIGALSASLAIWLAWRYPYGMNPDGQSYLDIADAWATGRFGDAINGYWSALLPVLMAPLRALGLGITTTFGLVGAAITFSVVVLVYLICRELGIKAWPTLVLSTVIGIRAAIWAIEVWTPDLLFAAVGLLTILLALRLRDDKRYRSWLLFGLSCGLLSLAKPVGLLTGVATAALVWGVWSLPQIRINPRLQMARLGFMTLGWGALAITWIILLSLKYGYFTTGSSGTYNLALTDWNEWVSPPGFQLFHPPYEGALTIGTDPTYIDFHLPYPVLSQDGIQLIRSNLSHNLDKLWMNQEAWIWVTALYVIGIAIKGFKQRSLPSRHLIVLGAAIIQTVVYLPVLFEDRYLLLSILLVTVGFTTVVSELLGSLRFGSAAVAAQVATLVFLLFPGSASNVVNLQNPVDDTINRIRSRHETAVSIQEIDARLAPHLESCSRIASWSGEGRTHLHSVQPLARANDIFVSGNIQHRWDGEEIIAQLTEYQVDCVLVWNNSELPAEVPAHLTLLSSTGDGWINLYRFEP